MARAVSDYRVGASDEKPAVKANGAMEMPERIAVLSADFHSYQDRTAEAFAVRDRATEVALSSLNSHLSVMNEFRGAMADQATRYLPREEFAVLVTQVGNLHDISKTITKDFVSREEMGISIARVEAIERSIGLLQGRYAISAVLLSAFVALSALFIAWSRPDPSKVETAFIIRQLDSLEQQIHGAQRTPGR